MKKVFEAYKQQNMFEHDKPEDFVNACANLGYSNTMIDAFLDIIAGEIEVILNDADYTMNHLNDFVENALEVYCKNNNMKWV